MDSTVANYIATGGVSGMVVCAFYFTYKCCYRKKIHSQCCGNIVDIKGENSPDTSTKRDIKVEVV
jgi:hypothetical protein